MVVSVQGVTVCMHAPRWIHPFTHALSLRAHAGLCRELFHKPSDSLRVATTFSKVFCTGTLQKVD